MKLQQKKNMFKKKNPSNQIFICVFILKNKKL